MNPDNYDPLDSAWPEGLAWPMSGSEMDPKPRHTLADALRVLVEAFTSIWRVERAAWVRERGLSRLWVLGSFFLAVSGLTLVVATSILWLPLLLLRDRRKPSGWPAIKHHARQLWLEGSPGDAIAFLQRVSAAARDAFPRGAVIHPFPKLRAWDRLAVDELLFEWLAQTSRWSEALALTDTWLPKELETCAPDELRATGHWLLARCRMLAKLGRTTEAKALLLRARDPNEPDSELSRALESLREAVPR